MTVKFTLEFATIDEAITALTKLSADPGSVAANAVSEINARNPLPVIDTTALDAPKPKAEKTAKEPAPAAEPSAPAAPAASTASSDAPAPSVDYPTLQKAVFALAGKSREAASAVAQSFGVKTFKELDASKWADALAAVNAKIAELG